MKFIDRLKIHFKSGKGGPGCASFASDHLNHRAGPDGGDGGRGGKVILRTSEHLNTLFHLRGQRQLSAKNGLPGSSQNRTGAGGADLVVDVPKGTMVRNLEGDLLIDLMEGEYVLLEGGRGGKGNWHFRNSRNQAPTHFQPGETGEELEVSLELKLIADIGVIGFPNAGKSTLVSVITAAKPKIADYPFTTIQPQLGVVTLDNYSTFTIADIPGLIEGASEGVGLGHQFLQHIERTKAFVHLIDASDFSDRDAWDDYLKINHELKQYDSKMTDLRDYIPLSERQQLVVLNKVDAVTEERLDQMRKIFRDQGITPLEISAAAKMNLDQLVIKLSEIVFGEKDYE